VRQWSSGLVKNAGLPGHTPSPNEIPGFCPVTIDTPLAKGYNHGQFRLVFEEGLLMEETVVNTLAPRFSGRGNVAMH
jgi:hypothetical protein